MSEMNEIFENFKKSIIKEFGNGEFSTKEARKLASDIGYDEDIFHHIWHKAMYPNRIARGKYSFPENHSFDAKPKKPSKEAVKKEAKKNN
jgi:hypothetical protein